jgi:hypothetical protein
MFVVEMLRWGDRECHSYVIGIFSTKDLAEDAGKAEQTWRDSKYEYAISEFNVDLYPKDKVEYYKKLKSRTIVNSWQFVGNDTRNYLQ